MRLYIGSKLIKAKPMNRLVYNRFRGWELPDDEDGNDEGYLVKYLNRPTKNTEQYDNYISWSPVKEFNDAYHQSGSMTFGDAIQLMKAGYKMSRTGWNGKGMWCIFVPGTKGVCPRAGTPYANSLGTEATIDILPHFDMFTVNAEGRRAMLPGWLASQSDMDACDWGIIY